MNSALGNDEARVMNRAKTNGFQGGTQAETKGAWGLCSRAGGLGGGGAHGASPPALGTFTKAF